LTSLSLTTKETKACHNSFVYSNTSASTD